MFTYMWPGPLDNRQELLATLGSFWAVVFTDNALVANLLYARAQLENQTFSDLEELVSSMSRRNIALYHQDDWYQITLLKSKIVSNSPFFSWSAPLNLVNVNLITDSITNSDVNLTVGQDFFLSNGLISFRQNPFVNSNISITNIFTNGIVTDQQITLWLYRSEWDLNYVYNQYGYAVGLTNKTNQTYLDLINSFYDSIITGTTQLSLNQTIAALYDAPAAIDNETVEVITTDSRSLWVITDKNTYSFNSTSTPIVGIGDILQPGDPITNAWMIYEFTAGQIPAQITSLSVGPGLLAPGYEGDITFENKEVALEVDTSGAYTKVSFEIEGTPSDIIKFWDDTQTNGIAAGETLAMLMDKRPLGSRTTQPTALALPAMVNPLGFLLQNVFRNNLFVLHLHQESFGPNALSIDRDFVLRKIVPPQNTYLVLMD